ncbi:response regulator transcription factor [Massilibacteroides sp.]|uniref:response regulator transcription factor n=1 Tax=Massilibacteroides sp. TaxID=2034766 RepID=UPI0026229BA3|nr:response regulator transcription factor [Massilibacteroides sp.]MDD4514540.1 response regulator transcription factor [Massilibacteroides sp.]
MKTIILADNQDITKAGILYLCDKISGYSQIVEADTRDALLKTMEKYPDSVVMLDYSLFDLNSIEELFIIQERFKKAQWVLFCEYLSDDFIRRIVFSSEAFGVVLKDASLEEIQASILYALRSERYVCNRISNMLLNRKIEHEPKEQPVLTATEIEILKAIALGKTTKEIAAERFSSVHTITTHRKNIFRKLEVNNIHEATKYALRAGIVDSAEYYI